MNVLSFQRNKPETDETIGWCQVRAVLNPQNFNKAKFKGLCLLCRNQISHAVLPFHKEAFRLEVHGSQVQGFSINMKQKIGFTDCLDDLCERFLAQPKPTWLPVHPYLSVEIRSHSERRTTNLPMPIHYNHCIPAQCTPPFSPTSPRARIRYRALKSRKGSNRKQALDGAVPLPQGPLMEE